jgi:multidrug efflux pump
VNISAPFLTRPVATTLLTLAVALTGGLAYFMLPVSPLPEVDFPTITVTTVMPGASPETMASAVATPLERQFGRIAGITEMTATNFLGVTTITLQFDLNRDVDAACREVQAAINAARGSLPQNLPNSPNYKKVNPADFPIMILTMTSDVLDRGQMYDVASTVLQQKLAQLEGVGQVNVGGASLPAVRIQFNPTALNKYGIEEVRGLLAASNANTPKGSFSDDTRTWSIEANDQLFKAAEYRDLVIAFRNNAPVRLSDIADVTESVEDRRNSTYLSGRPGINLDIRRQPGANIIETVERIKALVPELKASSPALINIHTWVDQTVTIRASIKEIEKALLLSIVLVILVVFVFLRDLRATLIPLIVVPVSLIGTFGVMYLFGYSLNNLSLMALTIATCFLVDDAIVVIENITRYLEKGLTPMQAARRGAEEIGFTVLSVSISLIAVFIPLLLMGGIIGRLFREFAVTLSASVAISLVMSLTITPVLCSRLLRSHRDRPRGKLYHFSEGFFDLIHRGYRRSLDAVLGHPAVTLAVTAVVIAFNVHLFIKIPKGFFPQQDTGRIQGTVLGDQTASFQAMDARVSRMVNIIKDDPAVASVLGQTGQWAGSGGVGNGSAMNNGRLGITLKPWAERKGVSADQVIARLRPQLSKEPGVNVLLQSVQDIRLGARQASAQFQYTLQSENLNDLLEAAPRLVQKLRTIPQLTDVNSDQQTKGLQQMIEFDRVTAARLGISAELFSNTLYSAFGQRSASTMYASLNQYRVIMEVAPSFTQNPESLRDIYIRSSTGASVPLSAVARYAPTTAPLSVNHQGQFPAVTLSFNLAPGIALSDAVEILNAAQREIGMPDGVTGSFQGAAAAFQASLKSQPLLIAAALFTLYIVLGILYESTLHPITILSTLPSAGLGAVLALQLCQTDLSVIAMIGIILLIGIVQKNAIIMIDFALAAERKEGKSPRDAIYEACLLRFRPILMTTIAALLGALPLALGEGTGSELRRPLGIAILGGLAVSQILTLYTTPVVYLCLDRLRLWVSTRRRGAAPVAASPHVIPEIIPATR